MRLGVFVLGFVSGFASRFVSGFASGVGPPGGSSGRGRGLRRRSGVLARGDIYPHGWLFVGCGVPGAGPGWETFPELALASGGGLEGLASGA